MVAEMKVALSSEDDSSLAVILSLFDPLIPFLGQVMKTNWYFRRFNILMAFLGNKTETQAILEGNSSVFPKTKKLFGTIKHQGGYKDGIWRWLLWKAPFFQNLRRNKGKVFISAKQYLPSAGQT